MWSPDYDIIVETLTGSEFEVTVRETDTIGYLKYRIKKYEGIPVSQQHILFQQTELKDATVLKDIPLVRGSRLTLVLGMRGGPISARRVVADCENWYDLSDVLNGTNRSQLAPIEPLTISTTGVKVLLYKDCKKNINRLMKLRKHHLHSHGANGTSSNSASLTGNNSTGTLAAKCSATGTSSHHHSSARTQLKFLDKHMSPGDESMTAAADAQNQQWLLDNITTLKKMKHLRQSLEAKKKKKPRSGEYDAFTQDLRDVQVDQEMHEKLQRWLHRVASNATHLTDGELTVPHPQPMNANGSSSSSSATASMHLFDRVRRKSAGTGSDHHHHNNNNNNMSLSSGGGSSRQAGSLIHPFSRSGSVGGGGGGGARKKDSYPSGSVSSNGGGGGGGATAMMSASYLVPMDEFCMIAKDYEKAGAKKKHPLTSTEGTKSIVGAGGGGAEDRFTASSLSAQQIDRRMMQGSSSSSASEGASGLSESERLKKRRESSQFEERLLTQFYDGSPQCENLFRAFATTSADGTVSKGQASSGSSSAGIGGSSGSGCGSMSNAELASKFRWRFNSDGSGGSNSNCGTRQQQQQQQQKFGDGLSSEAFLNSLLNKRSNSKSSSVHNNYGRDYRRWTDTVEEHVVVQRDAEKDKELEQESREIEELATVIIGKADVETGEESLLEAACSDILNDPDAFEDEDGQIEEVHDKRYELIDLMALESGDSDEEEESGDEEEEEEDCDDDDDPVLLYEDVDTGRATFLGAHQKDFWPNFDTDEDYEDRDADAENEDNEEGAIASGHQQPTASTPTREVIADASDEDCTQNSSEADGLEYDDFNYFPSRTSSSNLPVSQQKSFGKQSLPSLSLQRESTSEQVFLPRIQDDHPTTVQEIKRSSLDKQMGPSLPEIISRGAERGRREQSQFSEGPQFGLEHVSPGAVKREREERDRSCLSKVQLPDMKLLESDLKMMGLDMILNDSDDSFERTIKRHFRSESRTANNVTSSNMSRGECLLRSGNEELKRMKPVDDRDDWLIQLDVELANPMTAADEEEKKAVEQKVQKGNRCAKCNKKLGIIMIMKCHCGLIFCAQHRYAEAHNCAYDFKEEGKRILAKENPLVVGEKLPKI